ncbi:MAG: L-2-amino-thiazoline-4-carboxylic acid hydrolase [Clostridia bacterium]|nr:L-2-amino-thiazoline-4-carboxylic acid hydrolase [Clostridia bacterium]
MKYNGMPSLMQIVFFGSFKKQLENVFSFSREEAEKISLNAKKEYRKIISELPEFEKGDRFKMNIVSCAQLAAFVLSMPERPNVGLLTEYYEKAMMTEPMKFFCRMSGKKKFGEKDILSMKKTEKFKAADRNPYSWNMEYIEYPDESGYEARFTKCGICTLMKKLGLYDLTPALCHLDYAMSEAGKSEEFVREYTLASGGPYCDCGYKKKN